MAGPMSKHRVAYLHDPEVGQFYYGPSHPMKPHRMQLAHQLIIGYELHNKMICYKPHKASDKVRRPPRPPSRKPVFARFHLPVPVDWPGPAHTRTHHAQHCEADGLSPGPTALSLRLAGDERIPHGGVH